MGLAAASSTLVIIDPQTDTPKVFWKGIELTEVVGFMAHNERAPSDEVVRFRVKNTNNFDAIYLEMTESGIHIKKVNA